MSLSELTSGLLSFGSKKVLGVDIGSHSIKICEVSVKKGKVTLEKFGYAILAEGTILDDEIQKPEALVKGIKDALKNSKAATKHCSVGFFGPNTVTKRLQLPTTDLKDIEDQVQWESEQYIPFNVDESQIAFHIVGSNPGGGTDVLIAAIKAVVLDHFKEVIQDSGLKLKIADLQVTALCNAFECFLNKLNRLNSSSYLLIDSGAQKTSIAIYKNTTLYFSKEIPIAGNMITEELQKDLGLSFAEAESLKLSGSRNGNIPQEVLTVASRVQEQLMQEIKKSLTSLISSGLVDMVEGCFITGGNSQLVGMKENISKVIGIQANDFPISEGLIHKPGKFDSEILNTLYRQGAVAIGLAARTGD